MSPFFSFFFKWILKSSVRRGACSNSVDSDWSQGSSQCFLINVNVAPSWCLPRHICIIVSLTGKRFGSAIRGGSAELEPNENGCIAVMCLVECVAEAVSVISCSDFINSASVTRLLSVAGCHSDKHTHTHTHTGDVVLLFAAQRNYICCLTCSCFLSRRRGDSIWLFNPRLLFLFVVFSLRFFLIVLLSSTSQRLLNVCAGFSSRCCWTCLSPSNINHIQCLHLLWEVDASDFSFFW